MNSKACITCLHLHPHIFPKHTVTTHSNDLYVCLLNMWHPVCEEISFQSCWGVAGVGRIFWCTMVSFLGHDSNEYLGWPKLPLAYILADTTLIRIILYIILYYIMLRYITSGIQGRFFSTINILIIKHSSSWSHFQHWSCHWWNYCRCYGIGYPPFGLPHLLQKKEEKKAFSTVYEVHSSIYTLS